MKETKKVMIFQHALVPGMMKGQQMKSLMTSATFDRKSITQFSNSLKTRHSFTRHSYMQHLIITALLFFNLSFVKAQDFQFKCMVKSGCCDTLLVLKHYILEKDTLFYRPDGNGICSIPDTGTYFLTPISETEISFSVSPVPIKIDKLQLNIDTLHSTDLFETLTIHAKNKNAKKYKNWKFCDRMADGKLIDFTIDGYTEGTFKKGRALGEIKSYNLKGELIYIAYYNRKGKYIRDERTPAFFNR